jgi:hypothetical protein
MGRPKESNCRQCDLAHGSRSLHLGTQHLGHSNSDAPLHKVAPADDQLRLETMDKAGIDLAVLSVTTPGVQAESDAKVIE